MLSLILTFTLILTLTDWGSAVSSSADSPACLPRAVVAHADSTCQQYRARITHLINHTCAVQLWSTHLRQWWENPVSSLIIVRDLHAHRASKRYGALPLVSHQMLILPTWCHMHQRAGSLKANVFPFHSTCVPDVSTCARHVKHDWGIMCAHLFPRDGARPEAPPFVLGYTCRFPR